MIDWAVFGIKYKRKDVELNKFGSIQEKPINFKIQEIAHNYPSNDSVIKQ